MSAKSDVIISNLVLYTSKIYSDPFTQGWEKQMLLQVKLLQDYIMELETVLNGVSKELAESKQMRKESDTK